MSLFLLLTFTGVVLMFYYIPAEDRAYDIMKDWQDTTPFAMMYRNMHRWSAHMMVLFVFLHMSRVFYTGSYKGTRKFNWVIGVHADVLDLGPFLYRISAPLGPISLLGDYCRNQYRGICPQSSRL